MTLYSRPSLLQLWECPQCSRVENWHGSHRPSCTGTPECPHGAVAAKKLRASADVAVTDDRRLFR